MRAAMRSRAVSRPFLCCDSMAFAPPPWRICSSSFFIFVRRSIIRRWFFSKSGDFALTLDFRTEAATRRPRAGIHAGALKLLARRENQYTVRRAFPRVGVGRVFVDDT